ncbi:MAG: cell division protein FtsW, partial [Verrucomicrobia bacterium]|nr:cell division protein FtsW [Verrucomicrobiota bacterium]
MLPRMLFIAVLLLYALGLVMIFNTSSAEALDNSLFEKTHQALFRQCFYGFVGVVLSVMLFRLGYKRLLELSPLILAVFTFLLLAVFLPGIGMKVNGSRRWVNLAGWSLQPSEFVKYIAPLYFVYRLLKIPEEVSFRQFISIGTILSIPLVLILLEPNNGTAGVLGFVLTMVCFLAKVPMRYWALPLVCVSLVGAVFAMNLPYVAGRIQVYLDPEIDLKGKGHQPYQAKIASGSGGIVGKGPGMSLQKLSYLPEAQNDYIAAIFAEEYGFVGIATLISIYTWLGVIGFGIAMNAKNVTGMYVAAIITFLMTFQAFLNLSVVSGLVPSTGLNLPFFSQGGSSLIAHFAGVGL